MKDERNTPLLALQKSIWEEDKIDGMLPGWWHSKSWEYWETESAVYDTAEEGFSATDLKGWNA